MKAARTFYIGLFVFLLSVVQFFISRDPIRAIGTFIGLFFMIWGWKIGWTKYRNFTIFVGHLAVVAGCLVSAYALYQLPFLSGPPGVLEVVDLPLFWGLFTIWGGNCMITHGYCNCAIALHRKNNRISSE